MVTNMTEEERERRRQAIEAARETLADTAEVKISEPDYLAIAMARRVEHPMDRDRRELAERDAEWARQREASVPAAPSQALETWLHDRFIAERSFVLECVGQALGQALRKERGVSKRELEHSVRSLRIDLCVFDETIKELRKTIAASNRGSGEIIDLPAFVRRGAN